MINDQRQVKLKQHINDNQHTMISKNSMNPFIDNDHRSLPKQAALNRMTTTRLTSKFNERPSAIHNFFRKPE